MGDDIPLVSVVVPCRNEVGSIERFLDDLLAQEGLAGNFEVLVADGMSDDGTAEILARRAASDRQIVVIDNPDRIVSPGLNEAIRRARAPIIVRMDVHTRYASDYVASCLAVLEETGAANVGGAARTDTSGFIQRVIAAAYASPFAVGGARFHFPEYEGPVDTVTYGCWRREDLIRWGLFDEALVRNQDDELNYRITLAGGVIWQSARIRSWYQPRSNFKALFRQYFQYGRWKTVVIRKHRQFTSWRHLIPPAAVLGMGLSALTVAAIPALRIVALIPITLYLIFLAIGSVRVAARSGWLLLPALPVAFACFHFGYGLGFLVGLLAGGRPPQRPAMLTR